MLGAECLLGVAHGVCNRVPLSWNNCRFARTVSVTLATTPTSPAGPSMEAGTGATQDAKHVTLNRKGMSWT